jgi:hypothetical protein
MNFSAEFKPDFPAACCRFALNPLMPSLKPPIGSDERAAVFVRADP